MKKLKSIKNGFLSRNTGLLKLAVKSGVGILRNSDAPDKILKSLIGKDVDKFVNELSHYKGSITKAGQLLSLYGEYYLPDELNQYLKKLQSSTHYLGWDVIAEEIPQKYKEDLEIDHSPIAAASIGQVHKAKYQDQTYAMKIQYKGIDKAIDTDIFFLKLFLKSAKFLPKGLSLDRVFDEVKRILILETSYDHELKMLKSYKENLKEDPFFIIPTPLEEYCNNKILTATLEDGTHLSDLEIDQIPQEKRDLIGEKIFELFLKEIYQFSLVQTDAHGGNFLLTNDYNNLVLLDFGACVEYTDEELSFYRSFLDCSYNLDKEGLVEAINNFAKYNNDQLSIDEDILFEYMKIASSPLRSESFNWDKTNIPDQLFKLGKELQKSIKAKSVPHQFIFIDRKVIGVFTLLKSLKCEFNVNDVYKRVCL